jgi:hypothetical protein
MNKKRLLTISLLVTLLLLTGCKTAHILTVSNAPIPDAPSGSLTMTEVGNAIIKAGNGLGWEMHPKSTGRIIGTRYFRTHQAAVDIHYSRQNYTIQYRSSVNLKYDGTNIHKRYNEWVAELSQAIDATLASAQYK